MGGTFDETMLSELHAETLFGEDWMFFGILLSCIVFGDEYFRVIEITSWVELLRMTCHLGDICLIRIGIGIGIRREDGDNILIRRNLFE